MLKYEKFDDSDRPDDDDEEVRGEPDVSHVTTSGGGGSEAAVKPEKEERVCGVKIKTLAGQDIFVSIPGFHISVLELKERLVEPSSVPTNQQRLIFAGKMLENSQKLHHYNIVQDSFIHLVPSSQPLTDAPVDESGPDVPTHTPPPQFLFRAEDFFPPNLPQHLPVPVIALESAELDRFRSRARLLSAILMLYSTIGLLGFLALWMQPAGTATADGGTTQDLLYRHLVDVVLSFVGLTTGLVGWRATLHLDVLLSFRFQNGVRVLAMLSVANEVLRTIQRAAYYEEQGVMAWAVVSVIANVGLWCAGVYWTTQFHRLLAAQQ